MHRFSPASTLRRVAFLLVFGIVACSDEPPVGPGDDDEDPLPADVRSAVVIDTAGSVFRSIEIELDSAAQLEVFYQPVGGGRVFRIASEGAAAFHELPLPRLRQATDYAYAVRTRNDDAVSDSIYRGTFSTDSLPAELLGFEYAVTGASTFGMLMVPIRDPSGWAGQIAIESDGAIVWFMESVGGTLVAAPVPGTHDMIFIENGFPNDGGRNGIVRVSPDREVVALLERNEDQFGRIHHDLTAVDEERVYFLAYDTMTVRDTVINGEAVWEWNMTTGAVTKRWSSWDFFDWDADRGETSNPAGWFHANSISIGPRGNIVISSRALSQVFSISADFDSIEWRVGGPNATHALSEADRFRGQHSAWELPGGRVLLFDNHNVSNEPWHFSRALELQLGQDSAWSVFEYTSDPPLKSSLRGGVYRVPSGNTVVIYASIPFWAHEVTPAGEVVWTLTGDMSFTNAFRATPWPSIAGETEAAAMP